MRIDVPENPKVKSAQAAFLQKVFVTFGITLHQKRKPSIDCFKILCCQKIRLNPSPSCFSSYSCFLTNTHETEWTYWIWALFTFYNFSIIANVHFLSATFEDSKCNESFRLCVKDSKINRGIVYSANKPTTSVTNLNLEWWK